jgi:hypothetical protein
MGPTGDARHARRKKMTDGTNSKNDFLATAQRLDPLTIDIKGKPIITSFRDSFASFGSCFAQNLQKKLSPLGFTFWFNRDISAHYSAEAMANVLRWVADGQPHSEDELYFFGDTEVACYRINKKERFHGPAAVENALAYLNYLDADCRENIRACKYFVLTLGTARVMRLKKTGITMARGYGISPDEWSFHLTTVEENVAHLESIFDSLTRIRGGEPPIIFLTVSPQRYDFYKIIENAGHRGALTDTELDPFVDNTLNKSILKVAASQFAQKYRDTVIYFPSFEIVMDELRLFESMSHHNYFRIEQQHTPEYVVKRFLLAFSCDEMLDQYRFHERLWRTDDGLAVLIGGGMDATDARFIDPVSKLLDEAAELKRFPSPAITAVFKNIAATVTRHIAEFGNGDLADGNGCDMMHVLKRRLDQQIIRGLDMDENDRRLLSLSYDKGLVETRVRQNEYTLHAEGAA